MERDTILRGLPVVVLIMCSVLPAPGQAQFFQQGPKLVGTAAVNGQFGAEQGYSVSLSGDGSTAIVGGPIDNDFVGAAWVYTRSDGVWSQQAKLVGAGAIGRALQGLSVSLSDDGSTAIVGGPDDNNLVGAAWVFTRSGGVWSQQAKLVGAGGIGRPQVLQGWSVSLSADGNTAIVGGPQDNSNAGAAWVFTRSASGMWSQQGAKLLGTGAIGVALQGWSVSLSGDGSTTIVGGLEDNNAAGAAWVYIRSDGVWSQQAKLVGAGAVGVGIGGLLADAGGNVSLSDDGSTAIVGGADDDFVGAAWVFTRSDGVWSQQAKLVGAGAVGPAWQGWSVSLSGDGHNAIVGGPDDNNAAGAAWVFAQPMFAGTPGKANCHGQSVSALAKQYGGLNNAAAALGFDSVNALKGAIEEFCEA